MSSTSLLSIALLIFIMAAPCGASQYVVDGSNPRASDANPGSASLPFKTIQKAADAARAGDIVLIRPGGAGNGDKERLERETTRYAIISPTYLGVEVTRDMPYDVEAVFIR